MASIDNNDNSCEVVEQVKARLLEEGREARNLVAYSVPIQELKSPTFSTEMASKTVLQVKEVKKPLIHKQEKRHRSVSAGRNLQASLRARHWGFLFRNLEQAVDEIYQTCEDDESIIECKEAILMLERYTKDFHKLIEWLKLKWEFEKTPPPQRPTSVSWEIRTSSLRPVSSRRKGPIFADVIRSNDKIISLLTEQNVQAKNEIDSNMNQLKSSSDSARLSPPRKLTTVEENEIVDKIQLKEENVPSSSIFKVSSRCSANQNDESGERLKAIRKIDTSKEADSRNKKNSIVSVTEIPDEKKLEEFVPKKLPNNENPNCLKTGSKNIINSSKDAKQAKTIKVGQTPKKPTLNSTKDEEKLSPLNPVRSKSTTNLKNLNNRQAEVDSKKVEIQKYSFPLTGPTVNMNKASQVRQAYNQNRTPQKSAKPVIWKNSLTSQGSDSKFVPAKQNPTSKSVRRTGESTSNVNNQKKNWINYTRNCESAPTSRILVRSVTSLTESHTARKSASCFSNTLISDPINDCSQSNCSVNSSASSGQSWADKVKGCRVESEIEHKSVIEDDNEGWEVVRRGRRNDSLTSLNSPTKNKVNNNSKSIAFNFKMQKRFNQPTAAVSLPSLSNNSPSTSMYQKLSRDPKSENVPSKDKQNKCSQEGTCGSLNKLEKNICNNLRREESIANEAKLINSNKDRKVKKTMDSVTKSESRRLSSECISLNENTSDSEREEEEMTKNEAALATAVKEEQRLKKQIEETENKTIEVIVEEEVDVSSDGTSTVHEDEVHQKEDYDWSNVSPTLHPPIPTLSWAEMGDLDLDPPYDNIRRPGRGIHIHEKLSSPARHLSSSEKLKRHQEKLAKAEELRGRLIQEKTEKLKDLFRRIEDVNMDKNRLLLEERHLFEKKMSRADEKRKKHLQQIVAKAHDEENKAREIAFINDLEAQNKLHDIMQQHQSHESRLADMAEERSRKLEEKAAKEAAAQERRKAIEAERQARMVALCEKRKRRCERIDRQQAERKEELFEQAREKARDREERLSALQQAQQTKEAELVKKIQQKQEETARRHEEYIELIRQRAFESSITRCSRGCDDAPKLLRYEIKKLCTLCNSLIASEVYLLSHLKGRKHQEALKALYKDEVSNEQTVKYNLKHIVDAPENIDDPEIIQYQERQKSLKKRNRKIKSRIVSRGNQFLNDFKYPPSNDSKFKTRMIKALSQIGKLVSSQGTGPWPPNDVATLDKHLLELHRIIDKGDQTETTVFLALEGFIKLNEVLNLITNTCDGLSCVLPTKSLLHVVRVMNAACVKLSLNCEYILKSHLIVDAVVQLNQRLTELADDVISHAANGIIMELASDPVCTGLMEFIGLILETVLKIDLGKKDNTKSMDIRIKDVVSYCVTVGIVDKLTWYFNRVQGPVNNDQPSADFILASMKILSSLTCCLSRVRDSNDPTQLISTIQVTDSYGVVSLLYGLLLHQSERSVSPPSDYFSPSTLAITYAGTTLLCNLAELDLKLFQGILGSEGISLELRHICSFLLWYFSHWPNENILHNVVVLVGFFAVNNKENQSIIQSGESPTVLQKLCNLPWNYFTDKRLTAILFPTLFACSLSNSENLLIVEQEMSIEILQEFLANKEAADRPLVQILHKLQNIC